MSWSLRITSDIFFGPALFWLIILRELRIPNCHCWEMSTVLSKFWQSYDTKLFYFCLVQLEKFIFTERTKMC